MTIWQSVFLGDSLTEGTEYPGGVSSIAQGGKGAWWELVAEQFSTITGFGPLISSGFRGIWLKAAADSDGEWSPAVGSWTNTASTDLFDRGPYGQGQYSAAGSGSTQTWNKPSAWRTGVGVAIYYADYAAGGNWQYRIDGGVWTNMGQTLNHDGKICKFYVSSTVNSTVDVRAYDGAGSVGICVFGVELFYLAPSTAQGCIFHNLSVNGALLDDTVKSTSGDRLAFLDSVQVDAVHGGGAITNQPNAAIVMMHGRDVTLANTTTWATDLTTLYNRVHTLGTLLFMSPYELKAPTYPYADQTSYRAQTKTSAAAFGSPVPVLDLFDRYNAMGFGAASAQNTALGVAGLVNSADNGHETQAGHLDLAQPIYWFIRNNLTTPLGGNVNGLALGGLSVGAQNMLGGYAASTQLQTITATNAQTLATIKSITHGAISAINTQTSSIIRSIAHAFATVTETQTPSIVRSVGKIVSATETQTPSIVRSIAHIITAVTETQTPAAIRSVGKILSGTETQSLVTVKSMTHTVSTVTQTQTPSAVRLIGHIVAAVTQTQTAATLRSIGKILSATETQTPTITRLMAYTLTLSAIEAQTPSIVRSIAHALATVIETQTPSSVRSADKTVSATETQTPSVLRSIGKLVSAVETQSIVTLRSIAKTLTATETQTPLINAIRAVLVTLSVTQAQNASMVRSVGKTISITAMQTIASTLRQIEKHLSVTQAQTPSLIRSITKTFSATHTQSPSIIKRIGKILSVLQSQIPTLDHGGAAPPVFGEGIGRMKVRFRSDQTVFFKKRRSG